jgi:hypothetical protein
MTISLGMKITITMVVAMHHKCPEVEEVEADLAKQLQRRRYLEIDQSKTRMACGGHVN